MSHYCTECGQIQHGRTINHNLTPLQPFYHCRKENGYRLLLNSYDLEDEMLNPLKRLKPVQRNRVKYKKKGVPLHANTGKSNQSFINETHTHLFYGPCSCPPFILPLCTRTTRLDAPAVSGPCRRAQHPAPEEPHQPTGCTGAIEAVSGSPLPHPLRKHESERGLPSFPGVDDRRAERHGHQHQQQSHGEWLLWTQCQLDTLERRHQPQEHWGCQVADTNHRGTGRAEPQHHSRTDCTALRAGALYDRGQAREWETPGDCQAAVGSRTGTLQTGRPGQGWLGTVRITSGLGTIRCGECRDTDCRLQATA